MITGAHVIVYSANVKADRAFLLEMLGTRSVDAGGGWLIPALPPAEIAVHPSDETHAEPPIVIRASPAWDRSVSSAPDLTGW